ncbi:MAG TPA: formylmethanofuran dehydrogenase subunit A [Chloroflexi bacterium]|nr:formylmethanofuran dehydrogenase subunit A [Chloroflexota bacterium]
MLKITGGRLYDPINSIDGEIRDLYVQDGSMVPAPADENAVTRTLDATGMIVLPGGLDLHCHIAGGKVNSGRKIRPEDHRRGWHFERTDVTRSGTGGTVPSTFATGYKYAGMGYTTAFDAAVAPVGAKHTHEEFHDTPVIDKGGYILMGNNEFILMRLKEGDLDAVRNFVAWELQATKGYSVKIVNAGGVEGWKFRDGVEGLDSPVDFFEVTPRQIIQALARVTNDLGLPHPLHIHCNNLGRPGNWQTTLETMKALEGHQVHLTHIQFHSYGGKSWSSMRSEVPRLVEYFKGQPNLTVDVGQVVFGPVTTMTADGPWQYLLYQLTGERWVNVDIEAETGCGIVPYEYKARNLVNALQWAVGLEWFLLMDDPWRISLTTDHPNGGTFWTYPQIIKLLMNREYRKEAIARVNQTAIKRTVLSELDREYSLYEIAIITRAGPARTLGLDRTKGHLGPGAEADITIHDPDDDVERMFSNPRYVFKSGELIVEEGHIRASPTGKTFFVAPEYDPAIEAPIRDHFDKYMTIVYENYPVDMVYVPHPAQVATREALGYQSEMRG